jgi:putative heme degradation protein
LTCAGEPGCPSCAAIERARRQTLFDPLPDLRSPLTPGVQLVNLSHSEDGRSLRVDLGADWGRMLSQLPFIGEGLVMTRNSAAILGQRRPYPMLRVTSNGGKGANGECGLWLNFRHLGAARAVHRKRATGHHFGVQFADENGHLIHRFTLLSESNMDEFFAWVRLHQACTAQPPSGWQEEADELSAPHAGRALRGCDAGALTSVFAACVERALPLRVTVRGPAATQRAEFVPRSLQEAADWWFASDDGTGLHFQPELFTRIAVEAHGAGLHENQVTLCALAEDGAALVLEASTPAAEDAWRGLLEATA